MKRILLFLITLSSFISLPAMEAPQSQFSQSELKAFEEALADFEKDEALKELKKLVNDPKYKWLKTLTKNGTDFNVQDKDGSTALMYATGSGLVEIVKLLINAGANIDVQDNNGWTALMVASNKERLEIMKLLISARANLEAKDTEGMTALMNAANRGQIKAVQALIDAGADINAQDNAGWTTLMHSRTMAIANILLKDPKKINIETQSKDGNTALTYAANFGWVELVRALIDAGAKINAQDNKGWTALMFAVENGREQIVKLLLENGADTTIQNREGKTALVIARNQRNQKIIQMLESQNLTTRSITVNPPNMARN